MVSLFAAHAALAGSSAQREGEHGFPCRHGYYPFGFIIVNSNNSTDVLA